MNRGDLPAAQLWKAGVAISRTRLSLRAPERCVAISRIAELVPKRKRGISLLPVTDRDMESKS
jgi:hypothetical protein